jgi:hypothetical protein
MSDGAGLNQLGLRFSEAERDGVWPDDLVSDLRAMLDRYQDALLFSDRAASLPFEGFGPGESSSSFAGQLFDVQRLSLLRAELLALDGNGDQALDSYYTTTRLTRTLGDAFWAFLFQRVSGLQLILERTRPSPRALERVSAALAEIDHDDGPTRLLVNLRAFVIQGAPGLGVTPGLPQRPTHLEDVIARPWNAHLLNRQLEVFSRLLLAAQAPWPERIDRVVAVGEAPIQYGYTRTNPRAYLNSDMVRQAMEIAIIRSTRVVVAIERYRRAHRERSPRT